MKLPEFLFYFFEGCAALAAVGILLVRNVFHAALLLIVCLLSLAGIYVLAFAEFVAVTQILIYAGGILVLVIFGIMITSRISGKPLQVTNNYVLGGSLAGLIVLSGLVMLFYTQPIGHTGPVSENQNQINEFGILLMSEYLLPFEVSGALLLVALVGASLISSTQLKNE